MKITIGLEMSALIGVPTVCITLISYLPRVCDLKFVKPDLIKQKYDRRRNKYPMFISKTKSVYGLILERKGKKTQYMSDKTDIRFSSYLYCE